MCSKPPPPVKRVVAIPCPPRPLLTADRWDSPAWQDSLITILALGCSRPSNITRHRQHRNPHGKSPCLFIIIYILQRSRWMPTGSFAGWAVVASTKQLLGRSPLAFGGGLTGPGLAYPIADIGDYMRHTHSERCRRREGATGPVRNCCRSEREELAVQFEQNYRASGLSLLSPNGRRWTHGILAHRAS